MWLYGWKPITASHHLVMFGVHWSNASRDIAYVICYRTLQNHVIERLCGVIGGSFSLYVTILPSLVFLICHVISQDHVTKNLFDFKGKNIVGKGVHTPPFLRFPPFWKSKMSPPFIGLSGKQKYWKTLLTDLYILISTIKVP